MFASEGENDFANATPTELIEEILKKAKTKAVYDPADPLLSLLRERFTEMLLVRGKEPTPLQDLTEAIHVFLGEAGNDERVSAKSRSRVSYMLGAFIEISTLFRQARLTELLKNEPHALVRMLNRTRNHRLKETFQAILVKGTFDLSAQEIENIFGPTFSEERAMKFVGRLVQSGLIKMTPPCRYEVTALGEMVARFDNDLKKLLPKPRGPQTTPRAGRSSCRRAAPRPK